MTEIFCNDERHGTPCKLPCNACEDECDGSTIIQESEEEST